MLAPTALACAHFAGCQCCRFSLNGQQSRADAVRATVTGDRGLLSAACQRLPTRATVTIYMPVALAAAVTYGASTCPLGWLLVLPFVIVTMAAYWDGELLTSKLVAMATS